MTSFHIRKEKTMKYGMEIEANFKFVRLDTTTSIYWRFFKPSLPPYPGHSDTAKSKSLRRKDHKKYVPNIPMISLSILISFIIYRLSRILKERYGITHIKELVTTVLKNFVSFPISLFDWMKN